MAKGKGSRKIAQFKTGRKGKRHEHALQNGPGKRQAKKRDKLESTIVYADYGERIEGKADTMTGVFNGPPKATLANKLNDNRPDHFIRRKNDKRTNWEIARG